MYADTWVDNNNVLTDWKGLATTSGKPLGLGEWGARASTVSDATSAQFVTLVNNFARTNAGTGPGQFLYEILFDGDPNSPDEFQLYPRTTLLPTTSDTYNAKVWGK